MIAAPALAIPPDIASRAGRYARAAAERNSLREPEAAAEEEIPADAEVVDDEVQPASASEPVGTGTRSSVRRASHEVPASMARRSMQQSMPQSRPMPGNYHGSYVPSHQRMSREQFTSAPATIQELPEGEEEISMPMGARMRQSERVMQGDPPPAYDEYYGDEASYGYGPAYGRRMGRNWGDNCNPCCRPCFRLGYFEGFAGAHGFTGPLNRGTGSFGFQEGFNTGFPLLGCLTWQAGLNATQSNFEGAPFTPDDRTQMFVTFGAFRRVDLGLQAGLVIDYLRDDWDYSVEVTQLRGELGWKMPCGDELGFWFAVGGDHTSTTAQGVFAGNNAVAFRTTTFTVEPVDIYAFYYRRQLCYGGEGRVFGGFTDDSRGLLGGNIRVPLNPCWQFTTDFIYVVSSDDDSTQTGFSNESWNVSFNLVWTPFGQGSGGCQNYCRPLFDVANNGSFLTRLVQ